MRRRHAFTLVELLVVIGIITVLIAILLPVLRKAREQANRAVCASNQRQICAAVLQYANQNQGWLPRIDNARLDGDASRTPSQAVIIAPAAAMIDWNSGELMPYVARDSATRQRVFGCPSDPDPRTCTTVNAGFGFAAGSVIQRNFSYCLNSELTAPVNPRRPCHRVTEVHATAGTTFLSVLSARHSGFCNECFFDGHVELIDPRVFSGGVAHDGTSFVSPETGHYFDLFDSI